MNGITLPSAAELRIQARRLLKSLRGEQDSAAAESAERFAQLESYDGLDSEAVLAQRERIRLKHALAVLAVEHRFPSWTALKAAADDAADDAQSSAAVADSPRQAGREMYDRGMDLLFNQWFARYEDARASLEVGGGFLLPFDHQFFICESEGIRLLGLEPGDEDWVKIGFDWVKPADQEAWQRLRDKRQQVRPGR